MVSIENIYLGFRFAKILTRRRKYADLRKCGAKMRYKKKAVSRILAAVKQESLTPPKDEKGFFSWLTK